MFAVIKLFFNFEFLLFNLPPTGTLKTRQYHNCRIAALSYYRIKTKSHEH